METWNYVGILFNLNYTYIFKYFQLPILKREDSSYVFFLEIVYDLDIFFILTHGS